MQSGDPDESASAPHSQQAGEIARMLNAERTAFKAFLQARVGDDAEDLIQSGLIKAMAHAGDFPTPEHVTAWFYRVLRNAVIDHYRRHGVVRRRDEAYGTLLSSLGEDIAAAPPGWEKQICACLGGVIATLPARQAELLRRVDLAGAAVHEVARDLGITANNASVTLHRARQELRKKLMNFCGACAADACLDCHCEKIETGEL